jgi:hypothetical protein
MHQLLLLLTVSITLGLSTVSLAEETLFVEASIEDCAFNANAGFTSEYATRSYSGTLCNSTLKGHFDIVNKRFCSTSDNSAVGTSGIGYSLGVNRDYDADDIGWWNAKNKVMWSALVL